MGLHDGHDGVAGSQFVDTNTHEVFAHLRLPEQIVELEKRKKECEEEEGASTRLGMS